MAGLTLKDFAQKVEWEGGLFMALDYFSELPSIKGIAVKDHKALSAAWNEAAESLHALEVLYELLLEKKGVVVE